MNLVMSVTVYIDVLFLSNWVINSAIVFCAGVVFRDRLRMFKILLGGASLAAYSVIMFFPHTRLLYTALGKILCTALFVIVYYRPKNFIEFFRQMAVFLALSLVICGAAYALAAKMGGIVSNGVLYFDMSINKLLIAVGILLLLVKLGTVYCRSLSKNIVNLTISADGQKIHAKTLIDTGCEVKEPISGMPVVLISGKGFMSGIPIALSTVTSDNIVYARKADRIDCSGAFGIKNCLIAFIDTEFSNDGLYNAVASPEAFYIKHKKFNFRRIENETTHTEESHKADLPETYTETEKQGSLHRRQ